MQQLYRIGENKHGLVKCFSYNNYGMLVYYGQLNAKNSVGAKSRQS